MRMRLSPSAIEDVMGSVTTRDFMIACRKQFEHRYPHSDSGNVGNHPNAYVEAAQKYLTAVAAGAIDASKPVVNTASLSTASSVPVRGGAAAGAGGSSSGSSGDADISMEELEEMEKDFLATSPGAAAKAAASPAAGGGMGGAAGTAMKEEYTAMKTE